MEFFIKNLLFCSNPFSIPHPSLSVFSMYLLMPLSSVSSSHTGSKPRMLSLERRLFKETEGVNVEVKTDNEEDERMEETVDGSTYCDASTMVSLFKSSCPSTCHSIWLDGVEAGLFLLSYESKNRLITNKKYDFSCFLYKDNLL